MEIINATPGDYLFIGHAGEHYARQFIFDISEWLSTYGDGTVELLFQRPTESAPYPVPIEQKGSMVYWTISATETAIPSAPKQYAHAELLYYVDDRLVKSAISPITILKSLDNPGNIPDPPGQAWLNQVIKASHTAQEAVQHPPIPGADGHWQLWNFDVGQYQTSQFPLPDSSSSGVSDAVRYGTSQTLSEEEQMQARQNISALGPTELSCAVEDALAQAKASGAFDGAGLNVSGAAVGQVVQIAAVDTHGVPTAWTAVDMPSGGSTGCNGDNWIKADVLLASGAIAADSTDEDYETGLTLGDLKDYNEIVFIFYSVGVNTNVPAQVRLIVGESASAAYNRTHLGIVPVNYSGGVSRCRWMNSEKTLCSVDFLFSTSYNVRTSNIATTSFPQSGVGTFIGQHSTFLYGSTPETDNEKPIIINLNKAPTVDYEWKIRGVFK